MEIQLPSGATAWLVGDPHLGRKFERGVPAHRRGEREKSQFAQFVEELHTPDVAYNIGMGDLFEHPHVGSAVVVAAAMAYLEAAKALPETMFVALAGNHDLSRDVNVVGAWQLFCKIVDGRLPNLTTISKPCQLDELGLFPWQWDASAVEQVEGLVDPLIAVGHWDLQSYGGDDSHLCPTQELKDIGVEQIYSGHYHVAGLYQVGGHEVVCTGSLQPFTHAEDPEGEIYVTLSLAEATDGRDLTNKFVRLELQPGEVVPEDLDVQCLVTRTAKVEANEVMPMEDFDWQAIMTEALDGLTPEVTVFIKERLVTE